MNDKFGAWIIGAILALALCADSLGRIMTPAGWGVTAYISIGVLLFTLADCDTAPGTALRQEVVAFVLVVAFWPILVVAHLAHWD